MNAPRPLKRIPASDKDVRVLQQIRETRTLSQAEQPRDYRDKVVMKPWGHEFLVFENAQVAVWFLHIQKDHATSMHCHPSKRTALSVLWGKVLSNTFHQRNFLSAGDALNLGAGAFHSTKAMSLEGVYLLETECPNNKADLVRLEDGYGRQVEGYEGLARMTTSNLEAWRHFSFRSGERPWEVQGEPILFVDRFSISFEGFPDGTAFAAGFVPDSGALYNLCLGRLLDGDARAVVELGEAERGSHLAQVTGLRTEGPVLLLKIRMFD